MKRYLRNFQSISREEQEILSKSKVCVIGCGGLGGYIIEELTRLGIGKIQMVDGDVFDETNLNRQLISNEENLGQNKARESKKRMESINSNIELIAIDQYLDDSNAREILEGYDVLVDALDSIPSRILLERHANDLKIPLVHGAIAGWYGQVTTVFPGDYSLYKIYGDKTDKGIEKELGNPAFIPPIIGSIEVAEVIKILISRGQLLRKQILFIDLLDHDYSIIDLE